MKRQREFWFHKCWFVLSLLVALVPPQSVAQTSMAGHAMGTLDETPPDKYPAPEKLAGIGNVHIKITAKPEAQMWFDQGLNLFHDFWDYESVRAFQQSVRVDAQCAMCYWGLYQALTFRRSSSKHFAEEALAKAVSLKGRASKPERLYIEAAAEAEQAEKDDDKKKDKNGETKDIQILRKLVKTAPHDTQGRIFLAEALMEGYDDDGNPKKNTRESLVILKTVLRDEPENSAANHYWIHAVEASPHPEQAVHSAEILGRLAPTSGHMVHMPGHIFYRTGDYARAQQSFSASTEADERYMQAQHVQVDDDWNYVHNLMYAIANLMEAGKLTEATQLSGKLKDARGQLEATLYPWSPRDGMSRLDPRLPVAVRTADWAQAVELLKSSNPPETLPNLVFLSRQLTDFATGMQAVQAHDFDKAEEASRRLDAELWRISERVKAEDAAKEKEKEKEDKHKDAATKITVMPDASAKPLMDNVSIMSLELRASLLAAKSRLDDAKKLFAQAAQEEKDLGYREPPGYIRPVGETEAAALLAASAWTDAKAAYQKVLVERPKSGFSLYGLALASEQSGDAKSASTGYAAFVSAWRDADSSLPQLAHARAFLADHKEIAAGN
jgi:tetratricopeptide (TPR) repeat protein